MEINIVDCKGVVSRTTECNPYNNSLLPENKVGYDEDIKKPIISNTLPILLKAKIKVISIEDIIERYVKVEDSLRFKPTQVEPLSIHIVKEVVPKKSIKIDNIKSLDRVETRESIVKVKKDKKLHMLESHRIRKTHALHQIQGIYKNSDTLDTVANTFNVNSKDLAKLNKIEIDAILKEGKKLSLPLPYIIKNIEAKKKREAFEKKRKVEKQRWAKKNRKLKIIQGSWRRKLQVTATAYTSHCNQTDSTPFIAAWGNRIRPGMKMIAVSRDLLKRYGMKYNTKVRIGGLPGYYLVKDKMNKRYKKRIDIYMGLNLRRAFRWGRKSVTIYY